MSAGTMLLTIAAILVYCGLLQRVLDRMYLTDRQALLVIAAMFIGTLLPNVTIGRISIGIGGAIIPLVICGYLFICANETRERWHAAIGTILTAGGVYVLSKLLPAEAETLPLDPMWLYGLCGGLLAWLLGRSRRNGFICGVAGVILADLVSGVVTLAQGYQGQIVLGGGGIADAAVVSGVISVLLCELLGELIERMVRAAGVGEGDRG